MKKILIGLFAVISGGAVFFAFLSQQQALAVNTDLGSAENIGDYVNLLLDWIIPVVGGLAVLMLIYAGYIYITSQGNPDGVSKAKDIIVGVVVGTMLLFLIELILVRVVGTSL